MRTSVLLCLPLFTACQESAVTKFNASPTAVITSHIDGDTVREGESALLVGQVGDPDDEAADLNVTWTVGGSEVCEDSTPEADGAVVCEATVEAGGGTVILSVSDPLGAGASDTVELDVQPTDAPVANLTSPTATGKYYADQPITFQGTVADTEDATEDLTVSMETDELGDLGLDLEITSEGDVEAFGLLPEGTHAVRLRVVDTSGKEGIDSAVITVGPENSAPTCAITAPEDGSTGTLGDDVRFEGTASDVDVTSDALTARWESDIDGPLREVTPTSDGAVGFAISDLSDETHRITLTVTDDVGDTCTQAIYYTVGTPPTVTITAPDNGDTVSSEAFVVFEAIVGDEDDAETDLNLTWDMDGEVLSEAGADSDGAAGFTLDGKGTDAFTGGTHVFTLTVTDTDGLYVSDSITLNVNEPPNAPTVTISPDPAYTSDNLFASAAGSEDPDASGSVTYRYAWFVDGGEVPEVTGAEFPADLTSKRHVYRVEVFASDGLHEGEPGSAEITVSNTAPEITDVSITPDAAPTGTELTCTATAEDADDDTVVLTYTWSDGTEGDTVVIADDAAVGDTITCTATADDGDEGTATDTATATVTNTPPVMTEVTVTPDSGQVGDALVCAAEATDEDGDDIDYTYAWSTGTEGESHTITADDNPGDTITCTATATDETGASAVGTASATVLNTDPVIEVTVTPATAAVGETLTCTATASDADGETPDVAFVWSDGSTGSTTMVTAADDPSSTITCTATASDDDGGTDTDDASATVTNTDPVFTSISVTPPTGAVGDTLVCEATTTDADGDEPTMTYEWSDGAIGESRVIAPGTEVGSALICTATASDGDGGVVTATAFATVTNTSPEVTDVSIGPPLATTSSSLTCTATATDADGGTPTLSYVWSNDTAGTSLGSGRTLLLSADTSSPGDTIVCTVTATDDDGGTGTRDEGIEVENTPPSVSSVSISPSPLYNDFTALCNASATDPDGGSPTLSYRWTDSVGIVYGMSPMLSLSPATMSPGDTLICTVTATDEDGASAFAAGSATITNRPPIVFSTTISPGSGVTSSSTLHCAATALDPDDETISVTYSWDNTATGTVLGFSSSVDLSPSTSSPGDTIRCVATATDPSGAVEYGVDVITVENSPPVVTSVTLTPSTVYTNDTLSAVVATTDAEGDSVTLSYTWYINGMSLATAGNTLSGSSFFDKGDTVYVVVTPSDGTDTGSPYSSAAIEISNTAPTSPVVSISAGAECDPDYTLEFNGTDTHLSAPAPGIEGHDPRTVMAWGYIEDMGPLAQNLVTLGDGRVSHGRFSLFVDPTFKLIVVGEGHDFITGHYIEERTWTHIAATYDGSTLHVYANGERVATTGRSYSTMDEEVIIGRNSMSRDDGEWWNGSISEVKIWRRVLSPSEIADEMSKGIQSSASGLRAYLPMDEGTGATAYDESGAGHHASIHRAEWAEQGPFECDPMICTIDLESTDADGDSISYTFDWDVDAVEYSDTDTTTHDGDTVPGDALGYEETWTCEVTPNDGEVDGNYATAEHEIEDGWLQVFEASSSDLSSSSLDYDIPPSEWASATEVMIGFENPSTGERSNTAVFDIPSEWREQAPMEYNARNPTVVASIDGGPPVTTTLAYGYQNWGSSCTSWSGGTYGRVAVCAEGGPYWGRFAVSGEADNCAIYPSHATPRCSGSRAFGIWVR